MASAAEATNERPALIRQAFQLEYMTLAWMTTEATVAIGFGIAAGSLHGVLADSSFPIRVEFESGIAWVTMNWLEKRNTLARASASGRTPP